MSAAQVTGRLGSDSTVSDLSAALAEYGARRVWADGPFALASGASPEASGGTPRTICVVAGRITNAQALGAETGTRNADTERTIAVGWERWGEQVIARCRGSFVVVLWDREQGRGCVARDPLGHCAPGLPSCSGA